MANLETLETSIRTTAKEICSSKGNLSKDERKKLIAACDQLKASLETPVDFAFKLVFAVYPSFLLSIHYIVKAAKSLFPI